MVIVKKVSLSKKEMKIILALTCASVSANAWKEAEIEKNRLNLLLNDYIAYRLTALEEKVCDFFFLSIYIFSSPSIYDVILYLCIIYQSFFHLLNYFIFFYCYESSIHPFNVL